MGVLHFVLGLEERLIVEAQNRLDYLRFLTQHIVF
jgi:hypothetical protein